MISAIAYQPVSFSGRIARHELEAKRYTLGDLAAAIAKERAPTSTRTSSR